MPLIKTLTYIYPSLRECAFYEISMEHIKQLQKRISIRSLREDYLDRPYLRIRSNVLVHPIMYVFLGDRREMMPNRIRRLQRILESYPKIGGFDVADTDRLSQEAVDVLNKLDLIIVPSKASKECYKRSGVRTHVEVLPHGLNNAFLSDHSVGVPQELHRLFWLRRRTRSILCLFNLLHSGYRKGADLVYEVMRRIQQEYDHVYLVVKRGYGIDPYLGRLLSLRTIEVAGWFSYDKLRLLYDLCDICLVPSRGGGFEWNALEAMARGLVTLVPNAGCFLDYAEKAVRIRIARKVKVFENNPIHVGRGYEVDIDDFYSKLRDVIENLDEYRIRAAKNARKIRAKYYWCRIGDRLFNILSNHGFV